MQPYDWILMDPKPLPRLDALEFRSPGANKMWKQLRQMELQITDPLSFYETLDFAAWDDRIPWM